MKKASIAVLFGIVLTGVFTFAKPSSVRTKVKLPETSSYDLQMELTMNGNIISTPQINTKVGETALITQKTNDEEKFIEVTAIDGSILGNDGIMMTFVVGTIDKHGQRTILSRPQIFAEENKQAEITVEQDGGKETLSLSVLAKRKTL